MTLCSSCIITKNDTVVKLIYTIGLVLTGILCYVFRNLNLLFPGLVPPENECNSKCMNTLLTYRICLGLALYHALWTIMFIKVDSIRSWRALIHNGLWPIKFLIYGGFMVSTFFIPYTNLGYYGPISLAFTWIFLILQSLMLCDFAHGLSEGMLEKWEESESRAKTICWQITLIGITAFLYLASLADYVLLYIFFPCPLYQLFITLGLVSGMLITIICLLPKIRQHNSKSGLLQAAFTWSYTTYLITSAIVSDPLNCRSLAPPNGLSIVMNITGAMFTLIALGWSAYSTSTWPKNEWQDDEPQYSYSFFHITFFFATFYMCMILTNWSLVIFDSNSSVEAWQAIDRGYVAMWVRISSSWLIMILFLWTLIAPLLFPDRDFGSQ